MYITRYVKTAYWHPEEGGYYHDGLQLDQAYKVKHGKAAKEIRKIAKRLRQEYGRRWDIYTDDKSFVIATNHYHGEGEEWYIEGKRKVGCHTEGDKMYE